MFNPQDPEDLRAMLLHMAAASGEAPQGRQRVARWLRAALALVEDDDPSSPIGGATPGQAIALEELAQSLSVAAEHAEYLAERAALTARPPRS